MNKILIESQEGVLYSTPPVLSLIFMLSSAALQSIQDFQTLQWFSSPLYIMCDGIIIDFHIQSIFNHALGELAHVTFPQLIMSTLSAAVGPFGCALLDNMIDSVIELQRQTHKKIEQ